MLKQINKIIIVICVSIMAGTAMPAFAKLSCSITTAAGCTDTIVLRMSSATNAHAEMPNQSNANYSNNVICCSGLSGVTCGGLHAAAVLNLSSTTNAHVEVATNNNYVNIACMAGGSDIPVVAYQDTNCAGYDTTLASISSTTNATIASPSGYTKKVCGSLVPASLTFTLSTTTLSFGGLSSFVTRYASSTNTDGSGSEVEAHNFTVRTNALNGYNVAVQGATLMSGSVSITPIGNVNTSPVAGQEQFGLRIVATGGTGSVSSPYAASGFAYAASATTSSQVATDSVGDNATTTYSVRYVANVGASTQTGSYIANLIYIATANF